ncbi:MAG: hypothetical protein IPK58_13725 [Acidobacteria bacterium]|nr:hypothetical protein [Acidobacteriota bacterium]
MKKRRNPNSGIAFVFGIICAFLILCPVVLGQSGNQSFPTPLRANEVSGSIPARDIGDARLTTHFYAFNGNQGDIFINVVTKNFDGDIDVFTADTLKPLTKIVVYSDASDNETGRVIYLRQSQKLILRVEGRTPNDEPATYRLKFAGSFAPSNDIALTDDPKDPEVKSKSDSDVTVNSVGTIVAVRPKPTPKPVERKIEKPSKKADDQSAKTDVRPQETETKSPAEAKTEKLPDAEPSSKPEVVVTDKLPKEASPKTTATVKPKTPRTKTPAKVVPKAVETPKEPNPLESIRLIVLFKDGARIERPMSDVVKVSVDKGILTIIHKDGSIGRYSILDVAKMTIE